MSRKKIILIIISTLLLLILFAGAWGYRTYQRMNLAAFSIVFTETERPGVTLYIDKGGDYQSVLDQLKKEGIQDIAFFDRLSTYMKYPENLKSGKYTFDESISYLELIRLLRSGNQTPVALTFNNLRFKEDLTSRIGQQLMLSGDSLLTHLNDPLVCEPLGFDTATIIAMFIPNTYEIYWDTSTDKFIERMKKEYDRFWTQERLAKAEAIGLSPLEVSILASIVEEESAQLAEFPVIAGLYINRLKRGMLLQADPTVKFAVGDITLTRVLNKHLEVDSPYNTYIYAGLPPGPIRIPTIQGIDAVLNHSRHNYLYMCAKEDFSGSHNFAVSLREHNLNARRYQQALNRLNIR